MGTALSGLGRCYKPGEEGAFVQDVAFLYAGTAGRSQSTFPWPYWSLGGREGNIHLWIRPESIDPVYIDPQIPGRSPDPDANVHHWAWAFAMAYNITARPAIAINLDHEYRQRAQQGGYLDWGDIRMGTAAAWMGDAFRSGDLGYDRLPDLFRQWLGVGNSSGW